MAFRPLCLSRGLTHGRAMLSKPKLGWQHSIFVPTFSELSTWASEPLVFKSSQFAHLFEEGPTEAIYRGTPLYGLSQHALGKLAEEWAKRVLQEENPESMILDPAPGTDCNGNSRGLHSAPYDFLVDRRRVEVKSARLLWDACTMRWRLIFWNVKLPFGKRHAAEFDDLYLVALSPHGLTLVKHDFCTGVSTMGKRTESQGHVVVVNSEQGSTCWEDALGKILAKLYDRGSCKLVASESFHSRFFVDVLTTAVAGSAAKAAELHFGRCPMHNMSTQKRGFRIQAMGLAIDQILNPLKRVTSLGKTGTAVADWLRGCRRIELKSSGMTWDTFSRRWRCSFQGIKPYLFDELWLAIRSPLGVHFYKVASLEALGLGARAHHGRLTKQFHGPAREADSLQAFRSIEAKMLSRGCDKLAVVKWDHAGWGTELELAEKVEAFSSS